MNPILTTVCAAIDRLAAENDRVIVAIDGNCTAGKTTLAGLLQAHYDCNVIHMDDFFLRPAQRTPERFAQPGGNVDYERFREEVLLPLKAGGSFSYRPFDCSSFTLAAPVDVSPKALTIIEGTYSCHPFFGQPYDLTVFLSVSEDVQRQRVLQRPQMLHQKFFTAWIPMEQAYFDTFSIAEGCHLRCIGQEELWD